VPYHWDKLPSWSILDEHILRTVFMTYGFDNVKRLKPHLRYPGLKTEEIHRYVHQKTKLAEFSFLKGVCLDIDDVERYSKECIKKANPLVYP